MESRVRKVSSVMKPYIVLVLKRDGIPFVYTKVEDDYVFTIQISNRRFTEVLEDALCEKQRERYISRNSSVFLPDFNESVETPTLAETE